MPERQSYGGSQRGLSPATGGSKKDSERAITPGAEPVHVSAHFAPPKAKQRHHTHAQLSRGRAATGKKKNLASMHARVLHVQLFPTL